MPWSSPSLNPSSLLKPQDIPRGLPYKFTLFDEPMVLFLPVEAEGGSAEEPLCFVDRCPHRRAPLSDGALTEDGTVMWCAAHPCP